MREFMRPADPQKYYSTQAELYWNRGRKEAERIHSAHLPGGPSTNDMAMATLYLRLSEVALKLAESPEVT